MRVTRPIPDPLPADYLRSERKGVFVTQQEFERYYGELINAYQACRIRAQSLRRILLWVEVIFLTSLFLVLISGLVSQTGLRVLEPVMLPLTIVFFLSMILFCIYCHRCNQSEDLNSTFQQEVAGWADFHKWFDLEHRKQCRVDNRTYWAIVSNSFLERQYCNANRLRAINWLPELTQQLAAEMTELQQRSR